MRAYRDILGSRERLDGLIRVVLPDLQGPLDNLELICGSDIFAALHSNPETVSRALAHLAEAQIAVARQAGRWTTDSSDGFSHQHAVMLRGNVLIRNDSAILVSPGMYNDMVAPHDARVFGALGGGGIHSCGSLDRHAGAFLDVPDMTCIDFGQPELNDVDVVYSCARERRIPLIRVRVSEPELVSGSVMERFPTGVVLVHEADSLSEASRITDAYRQSRR
jgi:hypothetical protein